MQTESNFQAAHANNFCHSVTLFSRPLTCPPPFAPPVEAELQHPDCSEGMCGQCWQRVRPSNNNTNNNNLYNHTPHSPHNRRLTCTIHDWRYTR